MPLMAFSDIICRSWGVVVQLLRILLALTLFIAPLGARGQEPTLPVSLEKPCSVPADRSWTPQEKFVWERVCVGEDADFNEAAGYGGQLDPTKPEGWAQNRVLRPKFLQAILFKDPYRSALTRKGVVISGARFTEALDLENAELEHPLELDDSLLEKDVNLTRARSKFQIALVDLNGAGYPRVSKNESDTLVPLCGSLSQACRNPGSE